jgi:hypothetical protein
VIHDQVNDKAAALEIRASAVAEATKARSTLAEVQMSATMLGDLRSK